MIKRIIADRSISLFNAAIRHFGYSIEIKRLFPKKTQHEKSNKTCINVGSGNWEAEGWLNLDYPTEWYKKIQAAHKIIPYDIRHDNLPFEDDSVDLIYCSHVIEHIENNYIANFFKEAFRVLKKGGGIRITCPDAEYLYNVTKANKEYWLWRTSWFEDKNFYEGTKPRNVDFLVREIATPRLIGYTHAIKTEDYLDSFNSFSREDFFEKMTKDLIFRNDFPGDHINYWTFSKTASFLQSAGFRNVIQSKWSGSIFKEMQNLEKFDLTYPNMSLYVECVK